MLDWLSSPYKCRLILSCRTSLAYDWTCGKRTFLQFMCMYTCLVFTDLLVHSVLSVCLSVWQSVYPYTACCCGVGCCVYLLLSVMYLIHYYAHYVMYQYVCMSVCLSVCAACRCGGRYVYLWFTTIVHSLVVESASYVIPDIDNFWHAQSMVMLSSRRLPLHIVLLCALILSHI